MVPMPEQKAQLEDVLKTTNFMFDHKGVQIIELNFKGKKKKVFLHQIIKFRGKN